MDADIAKHELEPNSLDHILAVLNSTVGEIPLAGPLMQLALGQIPGQRIDRIAKYVVTLESRLAVLEAHFLSGRMVDPYMADVFEEGLRQAVNSLSDERREYIASLVVNSLSDTDMSSQESRFLLDLLGKISDMEVLILLSYTSSIGQGDEFYDTHKPMLDRASTYVSSPKEAHDVATIHRGMRQHLEELKLLEVDVPDFKGGTPSSLRKEMKGVLHPDKFKISRLGKLLIEKIGLTSQ